jgi:hypothetical protein
MAQSTVRRSGIISPNGRYVAVTRWFLPGAVGSNYVHVSVRSRFSPIATEVDSGPADPPDEPQVRWLDDHHLLITYWDKGQIEKCSAGPNKVENIEVLCKQ